MGYRLDHQSRGMGRAIGRLVAIGGAALLVGSGARAEVNKTDLQALPQYYGFQEMEPYKLDFAIGASQIVDMNGDGLNDIVIGNNTRSKVELLMQRRERPSDDALWNPEDPNELTGHWRMKRESVPVNHRIGALIVAELTGDHLPEIIYFGDGEELVVLGNEGEGRFAAPARQRVRKALPSLAAGDLDGDGDADVALLGEEDVFLFHQEPGGGLSRPVQLAHAAGAPKEVNVIDVDGDGRADLVIMDGRGDYPVLVRLQSASGELGPQQRVELPSLRNPEWQPLVGQRAAELIAVETVSGRLKRWQFEVGDSTAGDASWPVLTYPFPNAAGEGRRPLAVGDANGDGRPDVVTIDPAAAQILLYGQRPESGLSRVGRFGGQVAMRDLRLFDFDGDGTQEVIVVSAEEKAVGVSRWDGTRLTFPRPLTLDGTPHVVDFAPGGDRGARMAAVVEDADSYYLVMGDIAVRQVEGGPAVDMAGDPTRVEIEDFSTEPVGVRFVDVNQDGREDVLVFAPYEKLVTYLQDADGRMQRLRGAGVHEGLVAKARLESFALADVTGDGRAEVLLAQRSFARALRVNAAGRWEVVDQLNAPSASSEVTGVTVVPLEAGGYAVALYDKRHQELHWLEAGDDGSFESTRSVPVGQVDLTATYTTRLHGGGHDEVLLCGTRRFAVVQPLAPAFRAVEQGVYEATQREGRLWRARAGDLNHDGRADIVVVDGNQNHLEILTLGPKDELLRALRFKVFATKSFRGDQQEYVEPREIRIGDVTGDGHDDLVLVVHDRVIVYPAE